MQLHINYLLASDRLLNRPQETLCDKRDVLKAARRSRTIFLLASDWATFTHRVPPIRRLASANCCRLWSEPSLWLSLPGAPHPANPFFSRAGGRAPPPESRQLGHNESYGRSGSCGSDEVGKDLWRPPPRPRTPTPPGPLGLCCPEASQTLC